MNYRQNLISPVQNARYTLTKYTDLLFHQFTDLLNNQIRHLWFWKILQWFQEFIYIFLWQ
jgi:hypothetical protein